MKMNLSHTTRRMVSLIALATGLAGPAAEVRPAPPNTLTQAEQEAGWQLLFDGKTTTGWRQFKRSAFPNQGWTVEDGCLKKVARVRGGDIITTGTFAEFDLQWEWRLPPRANNGVKYFITEERNGAIGHEYQLMDDAGRRNTKHATGSFYDVLPPIADKPLTRINDWNHSRILVQGIHVEHWLNGVKILEYELGSEPVKAAIAASKFRDVPGFGSNVRGHILLTDHGDECWFRTIKIRDLAPPDK